MQENNLSVWSFNRVMLPHRPPVGAKPSSAMNADRDGPSSRTGDLVRTASVVIQDNKSRGIVP